MELKNSTARLPKEKSKDRRPYGTAPLEMALPDAIETLEKIAQEGKSMPESKLALVLGNTVTSSAFTRKVRALSVYGLLEDYVDGEYRLTDLALAIALPRSPQSQMEAKKQAFLRIEQFAFLFNQHKGKLLPADEFLRNIMEQEQGIPRDVSQVWVRQFKDGARIAGLFHNRGDGKVQITESPVFVEPVIIPLPSPNETADARGDGDGSHSLADIRSGGFQPWGVPSASGHCTKIDLSDGRRAEINIPDRLSPRDAQKLQRALDGIKVIIESMISEE